MVSTFGVGQQHFGRFMDLQQVAQGLGYHGFGLARLTRQVSLPSGGVVVTQCVGLLQCVRWRWGWGGGGGAGGGHCEAACCALG